MFFIFINFFLILNTQKMNHLHPVNLQMVIIIAFKCYLFIYLFIFFYYKF